VWGGMLCCCVCLRSCRLCGCVWVVHSGSVFVFLWVWLMDSESAGNLVVGFGFVVNAMCVCGVFCVGWMVVWFVVAAGRGVFLLQVGSDFLCESYDSCFFDRVVFVAVGLFQYVGLLFSSFLGPCSWRAIGRGLCGFWCWLWGLCFFCACWGR